MPDWKEEITRRLRSLNLSPTREAEIVEELTQHLEERYKDLVTGGAAEDEAQRMAREELRDEDLLARGLRRAEQEEPPEPVVLGGRGGSNFLGSFSQDIRYGVRMLGKSWALAAILVITLALGIGVNTAVFSVVNGWLFRPLPVHAPEQIMVLAFQIKGVEDSHFSYLDLQDFKKQTEAFSDVFGYATGAAGLSANGQATEFAYSAVTGNYFSALGVKPLVGRFLLPGEGEKPGEEVLVVLGYSFWQKRFGGNAAIIGKQVLINGKPATVIGVTPREFHGTFFAFDMDGYLSLNAMPLVQDSVGFSSDRHDRELLALGRLKPGVSLAQAQSSVAVIARRLAAQYPATDLGAAITVIPEWRARPAPFVASFVPIIAGLFLTLPALVLLLACLNVANIQLVRTTVRQREVAIRAALGAARSRLIRQMLTESLLVALLGGIGGVILGEAAMRVIGSMLHSVTSTTSNLAYRLDYSFDWRVFAYTLGAVVLSGIFLGAWPAFRAGRADLGEVLHEGGRSDCEGIGRHRLRSILLVAQVAGSLMLLIVAGLFIRSLRRAERMDLGFDPDHVLSAMLDVHQVGYDEARARTFYRDLEDRVRALPGVRSVSLAYTVPLGMPSPGAQIYVEGRPPVPGQQPPEISFNGVEGAYFETLRVPLLEGRTFTDADNETAPPVAIVNQAMAKKFWPNQDPIGKRFSMKSATGPFIEVVGLARDGQTGWMLSPESQPYFCVPLAQNFHTFLSLQVRTSAPPASLNTEVQGQIHALAPALPILDIRPMQEAIHGLGGLFIFRLAASLAAFLGLLGLTLATVGVYGVVSFAASRRTREIGIRMALGAERRDILRLTLRQGFYVVIAGVITGLVGAGTLTRAMSRLLIGVSPTDPVTYLFVAALLSTVAMLACYIPARRATEVDPMVALRYE